MTRYPPEEETRLMERFIALSVDEGRALYATLSPAEQAAMDKGGLKQMWRSRRARKARDRPKREWREMLDRRDKEEMAAWKELREAEGTLRLLLRSNAPLRERKQELEGAVDEVRKKLAERRKALSDGSRNN